MLKLCAGRCAGEAAARVWELGWDRLDVSALHDGDEVGAWETVMTIEGDYSLFAHLETVFLGALDAAHADRYERAPRGGRRRRQTDPLLPGALRPLPACRPATGTPRTSPEPSACQHRRTGLLVGRKGHRAPCLMASSPPAAAIPSRPRGASPTVLSRSSTSPALVDFDNDCVGTSLACARALGDRLWGVRLDTSETLVDRALWPSMGSFRPTGVARSWCARCGGRWMPRASGASGSS